MNDRTKIIKELIESSGRMRNAIEMRFSERDRRLFFYSLGSRFRVLPTKSEGVSSLDSIGPTIGVIVNDPDFPFDIYQRCDVLYLYKEGHEHRGFKPDLQVDAWRNVDKYLISRFGEGVAFGCKSIDNFSVSIRRGLCLSPEREGGERGENI